MTASASRYASLEQVLITRELHRRPARKPDPEALDRAMVNLTLQLSQSPDNVLQLLAESAMRLTRAHTCGISIEEGEVFRWHAMAGKLAAAKGGTMMRSNSPCGMVLDQNENLLFTRPELHFPFPGPVDPPIVEVLLTPFYTDGKAVGTIWVVAHDEERKFDREDERIVMELARFATSAFAQLTQLGYVQNARAPQSRLN